MRIQCWHFLGNASVPSCHYSPRMSQFPWEMRVLRGPPYLTFFLGGHKPLLGGVWQEALSRQRTEVLK